MKILLNIPFAVDVFIKALYANNQNAFQLGFGPSNFVPEQCNSSSVDFLSCLSLLPEFILFLPEFRKKLSVQTD